MPAYQVPTARSVDWRSTSIWSASDGSGLLRLDASSIQTDREGTRRIVRVTNGMTKACATTSALLGIERPSSRVGHKIFDLVLHPQGTTGAGVSRNAPEPLRSRGYSSPSESYNQTIVDNRHLSEAGWWSQG